MGFIYKITNDINGKIYIGKTEHIDPDERFKEHLQDYKRRRNEKRPLYDAMNKYGVEHFRFEVIEECKNTSDREIYWIEFYRTYIGYEDCNGYNATLGGDGRSYLNINEENVVDYYLNDSGMLIYKTANYFNVDSKTIKNILTKHNVKVKTMKEHRKESARKIVQLNKEDLSLIAIHDSLSDANTFMGRKATTGTIKDVCKGRIQSAYGYRWMYYNDYLALN